MNQLSIMLPRACSGFLPAWRRLWSTLRTPSGTRYDLTDADPRNRLLMPKTKIVNPSRLFRSILCPVDFSEHSATALRYAAAIAKRSDARLHALYVNDPMLVAAAAVALNDRELVSVALEELRTFVASAVPDPATRDAESAALSRPAIPQSSSLRRRSG